MRWPRARRQLRQLAHAVPESLGNRTLFTRYDCDACNWHFGRGIENDLGYWSKPMRTMARIRGKSGVPTIKNDSGRWRLVGAPDGLAVNHDHYDDLYEVDEARKEIKIKLARRLYARRGAQSSGPNGSCHSARGGD